MNKLLEKLYVFLYNDITKKVYSANPGQTFNAYLMENQLNSLSENERDLFEENWLELAQTLATFFIEKGYRILISEKNIYINIRICEH
jgi:hypothetical protein